MIYSESYMGCLRPLGGPGLACIGNSNSMSRRRCCCQLSSQAACEWSFSGESSMGTKQLSPMWQKVPIRGSFPFILRSTFNLKSCAADSPFKVRWQRCIRKIGKVRRDHRVQVPWPWEGCWFRCWAHGVVDCSRTNDPNLVPEERKLLVAEVVVR
jgi:hypothetical protein